MNGLTGDFYDYYIAYKTVKKYQEALKKKYGIEEVGAKVYVVSRYLKCQMTDEKSKEYQSWKIHKITHETINENKTLDDNLNCYHSQPHWKSFKNLLRHKTK